MGDYAVVVGSLNIDLVIQSERMPTKGESVLGNTFNTYPGGKGANQAVQLARLGMETFMMGRVGHDAFADQLIGSLEAAKVRTDHIIWDETTGTGKGWVLVDRAGDNYIIVIPEANMAWHLAEVDSIRELIAGASLVLAQLEIPVPIVEKVIRLAAQAQVMTVLNPAPALPLSEELLQDVDLLVLNESEAAFYLGDTVDSSHQAVTAAQKLQQAHGGTVIVTLGQQGAVAADEAGMVQAPSFQVPVVDVTAAGDSFCSSLAYALVSGKSLETAVRFACASGGITVTRPGAQPSLPKLKEINEFMKREGEFK